MLHLRRSVTVCAAGLVSAVMLGSASAEGSVYQPANAASFVAAAGDTWPMFGRDGLHSGVSPGTAIGASTAPSLTTRWSQPLGTTSDQPSPVVAYNGTLGRTLAYYVTYTGVVSAFSASTGALVWRRTEAPHVFTSPAVYGDSLYVGDNEGKMEALNAATGAVQCTFTLPVVPPAKNPGRIFSSPVVGNVDGTGPTVFFGDAGVSSSGETLNSGHLWAVTGVGNTAGRCRKKWVYSNWPDTGPNGTMTGVWDEPGLAREDTGAWAVVFGTSNPDGAVYALNAATGSRLWRFQTLQTGQDQDVGAGPTISPPGVNGFTDGVVYIDGKDGIEYALNLLTGKRIWLHTLGAGSASAIAVSTAALAGNTLVAGYAGSLFALNATTGALIWRTTPGGTIQASPAVSGAPGNQAVFVGDNNDHEYGFSLANGARLFSATTAGQIQDSAAIADGVLYFASGGILYAEAPG